MSSVKVASNNKKALSDYVQVQVQQTVEDITEALDEDFDDDTQLELQVINQNGTISLNTGPAPIVSDASKGSFVK